MITKNDAIQALNPTAGFATIGGEIVQWDSTDPQPTEQEIEVKLAELQYQEEVNVYQEKRKLEYPDWGDQLDKIYHSGINAWKADIKAIKDKYPKQTMDTTELQKRKDAALFKVQKKDYEKAVARLAQYELANGKKGVVGTEKVWKVAQVGSSGGFYVDTDVIGYIIKPLPIEVDGVRNPLIVQDETERAAAQKIINNTPQAVIDSVSS